MVTAANIYMRFKAGYEKVLVVMICHEGLRRRFVKLGGFCCFLWAATLCKERWSCEWGRKERNRAHWTPSPLDTETSSMIQRYFWNFSVHIFTYIIITVITIVIIITVTTIVIIITVITASPVLLCSDNADREESSSWCHKPTNDQDLK